MAQDAELHLHLPAASGRGDLSPQLPCHLPRFPSRGRDHRLQHRHAQRRRHRGAAIAASPRRAAPGRCSRPSRGCCSSSAWWVRPAGTMFHALVGRDLLRLDRETRRGTVALALLGLLAALAGIGIEGAALTDTGGAGILQAAALASRRIDQPRSQPHGRGRRPHRSSSSPSKAPEDGWRCWRCPPASSRWAASRSPAMRSPPGRSG